MFWRKKRTEDFEIELDDKPGSGSERRESFRVGADPDNPVIVTVDGEDYCAANISSGGLALRAKVLKSGRKYTIRLQLPDAAGVGIQQIGQVRQGRG